MSDSTIALISICVILVLLPPKYDPAIRLKERMLREKDKRS